jgi:YYY domain-containing protein
MDFSYWNAVMRSTIFPPYDPWYSGGYLNYYYYGYVIVGTPIKLIGIMPQIAYNLILPMLFAVTGMGAFSVAYNIVAARGVYPRDDGDSSPDASGLARRRWALRTPHGSPILAGIAAALMCVVLGNLDTPRIIMGSIAQAGGYTPTDVYTQLVREFEVNNGRAPTAEEANKLKDEAIGPNPIESFRLGVNEFGRWAGGLVKGFESISRLGYIPVGADRWFWGPSRVLGELPGASSEITEFPAFTFIYADLHAHMIAMPIQLLAILWLLGEVLAAERTRPRYAVIGATAFGGLVVGILFPTNTWDWITYMLLAIVGLTFAVWLRAGQARSAPHGIGTERERGVGAWLSFILNKLTRRSVMEYLAILVGFFIAQQIAGQPFRAFFATGFTSVNAFAGNKSPIWAFLIIHGLFIFLITSLLVWQTIRALRRTYVKDIIGNRRAVLLILSGLLIIVVVTLVFTVLTTQIAIPSRQGGDRILFDPPYPAALLVIPLLGWSIILFFLPDQSREMRVVLAINMLILSLIMGAEMVTLANDSGRQNTIFKLYMQVWVMFACIGGVALAWLVRASERWGTIQRSFWLGAAASLFAIAGLFPLMASQGKIAVRMAPNAPRTLDGLEYMKYATYAYGGTLIPLAGDHAIITWLQDNVRGTPVILEAQLPEYQLGSRIVSNTGLPTVLGYRYHQSQQRSLEPMGTLIWGRVGNIASAYNTTDYDTVRAILRHYNVEYIIVGGLERAVYKPEGLQKFEAMVAAGELEVVYAPKKVEGDVSTSIDQDRIYRVLPRAKQFVDVAVVGGGQ